MVATSYKSFSRFGNSVAFLKDMYSILTRLKSNIWIAFMTSGIDHEVIKAAS